jgi:hypothetical protein
MHIYTACDRIILSGIVLNPAFVKVDVRRTEALLSLPGYSQLAYPNSIARREAMAVPAIVVATLVVGAVVALSAAITIITVGIVPTITRLVGIPAITRLVGITAITRLTTIVPINRCIVAYTLVIAWPIITTTVTT